MSKSAYTHWLSAARCLSLTAAGQAFRTEPGNPLTPAVAASYGVTTCRSGVMLSPELTKRFNVDVSLVWDRVFNPNVGPAGLQPKPDDFRLVVGMGVDF